MDLIVPVDPANHASEAVHNLPLTEHGNFPIQDAKPIGRQEHLAHMLRIIDGQVSGQMKHAPQRG